MSTTARRPVSTPPLTTSGWLRLEFIERALARVPDAATVLEIGAGKGAMAVWLASRYDYTGVEPDSVSSASARARLAKYAGAGELVASLDEVDPARKFDVVCAFEVLEHIEDDTAALVLWSTRLRPGGMLVMSMPAFQSRYGAWDEMVGHFRRYEPENITAKLADAGLVDAAAHVYGFPLGTALERGRHLVARRSGRKSTMDDRTASSGRVLQTPDWSGFATRAVTAPFRRLSATLQTRRGMGLVVSARCPA